MQQICSKIIRNVVFLSCSGQYLLDNDVICYVGKVVAKAADHDSDDDDLDEELRHYNRPGSALFVPGRKARKRINDYPISDSQGE